MDYFAVIDTETNWNNEVMSIGVVIAEKDTFKKVDDGIWEYCGDCFRGENHMHGKDIPYVR